MQKVARLIDYFVPDNYSLELRLEPENKKFSGTVKITGGLTGAADTVRLHARHLVITEAKVDNKKVDARIKEDLDELQLTSAEQIAKGEHTVEVSFNGEITDTMHGLYPCYYNHNGTRKQLLATQFESHHAREVFPSIDEPEAKATFELKLITDKNDVAVGNMPIKAEKEHTSDGKTLKSTTFETTPRMSTYLLAFVTGEMQSRSAVTKDGVTVTTYTTVAQNLDHVVYSLETAVKSIEFFNDYFGVPYPLPKLDNVALPEFDSAAMENWGLITYREVALLVDPKHTSQSIKERLTITITHEVSHQWFGNLVTMRWWDDLWLNESFATLMATICTDALHTDWDMWTNFIVDEGIIALRRDALPGVQAVKVDVNHPDEIGAIFDPYIVYAKGARLLYMLEEYVGTEAFRKGLSYYFAKHAYKNTVGDDLWDALSLASDKDIRAFMQPWLEQSGFPMISVDTSGDKLELSQQHFLVTKDKAETNKLWPVPLHPDPPLTIDQLTESKRTMEESLHEGFIRLNCGASGHYIVRYTNPDNFEAIQKRILDGAVPVADRIMLLHDSLMQARGGVGSVAETLDLLDAYINEEQEPVWTMMSLVIAEVKRIVEGEEDLEKQLKRFVRGLIDKQYKRLGWVDSPQDSASDIKLRAIMIGLGIYTEDDDFIGKAKQLYAAHPDPLELPAEQRGAILSAVIRHGGRKEFDALKQLYKTTNNSELQRDINDALTSSKDPKLIAEILSSMTDTSFIRLQDTDFWFIYLMRNRYARDQAWQWMVDNWDWITKNFGGDKSFDTYPRYAAMILGTNEWLARYKDFFEPKMKIVALKRTIEIGIDDIASRAEWRDRDLAAVREFLTQLDAAQQSTAPTKKL